MMNEHEVDQSARTSYDLLARLSLDRDIIRRQLLDAKLPPPDKRLFYPRHNSLEVPLYSTQEA